MSCIYRGAWYGPNYDNPAEAGTEVLMDRESYQRFNQSGSGNDSTTTFPHVTPESDQNNGYATNHPQYFRDSFSLSQTNSCEFYINMVKLEPEVVEVEGHPDYTIWHPSTVYSGNTHYFSPAENITVTIFTELLDNSPTAERPSQWDHYWDGYQFTIPMSGDRWRFTPNQDIGNDWWIQFAEFVG